MADVNNLTVPTKPAVKYAAIDSKVVAGGAPLSPSTVLGYLRLAQEGDPRYLYAFYDEMLARDSHLNGEMQKAIDYITNAPMDICAPQSLIDEAQKAGQAGGGADVARAEEIAGAVKTEFMSPSANIHGAVESLAWAFAKGVAAINPIMEPGTGLEGRERVLSLDAIPAQRFCWGITAGKRGNDAEVAWYVQTTEKLQDLKPVESFGPSIVFFEVERGVPNLSRRGILRRCLQPWTIRNWGVTWWSRFVELFGIPMRIGYYNESDTSQKQRATDLLRDIGADGFGALPQGAKVEFPGAAVGGAGDIHSNIIEWAAREISKAIHGSTQTADISAGAGSQATAVIHDEVAFRRTRARARAIENVVREQLIRPYVARNFSPDDATQYCPEFHIRVDESVDRQALAVAMLTLKGMGMKIPEDWAYETLQIPKPEEGEAYVGEEQDLQNQAMADAISAGQAQGGFGTDQGTLPPKKEPKALPPASGESYSSTDLPTRKRSMEPWAMREIGPEVRAALDPYAKLVEAAAMGKATPAELASMLLRRAGQGASDGEALKETLTAIMAHAVLTGRK